MSQYTSQKPAFCVAVVAMLVVTGLLDLWSTFWVIGRAGGWELEMNPIFRLLQGATSNHGSLIVIVRVTLTLLVVLYVVATVKRLPELYPVSRKRFNLYQFVIQLLFGRDISFLEQFYLVPPVKRLFVGTVLPVAFGLIYASTVVVVTNMFGLLDSTVDVVVFYASSGLVGPLSAFIFMHREYNRSLE